MSQGIGDGRALPWGAAIVAGLAVAAALIVVPRIAFFEPEARDACRARGAELVGLDNGGGRYSDPVPEGARCTKPAQPSVDEVPVDFFADNGALDALLGWLYRLLCVVAPLATALVLGRSAILRPR